MGIIEFKDVSFQYPNGFSAVENVSFEINEGEAIAIIGQNGAGKTTTVKMINGLLKPTHGTVLIDGMDTKNRRWSFIRKGKHPAGQPAFVEVMR